MDDIADESWEDKIAGGTMQLRIRKTTQITHHVLGKSELRPGPLGVASAGGSETSLGEPTTALLKVKMQDRSSKSKKCHSLEVWPTILPGRIDNRSEPLTLRPLGS